LPVTLLRGSPPPSLFLLPALLTVWLSVSTICCMVIILPAFTHSRRGRITARQADKQTSRKAGQVGQDLGMTLLSRNFFCGRMLIRLDPHDHPEKNYKSSQASTISSVPTGATKRHLAVFRCLITVKIQAGSIEHIDGATML
jgi:hypothetical protein